MHSTNRALTFALCLLLAAPLAGAARADSHDPAYLDAGGYLVLGGTVGIDQAVEDEIEDLVAADIDVDAGVGLKAKAGYRAPDFISGELEIEYIAPFDVSVNGTDALELEYATVTLNARPFLALGRLQPFAIVGVGFMYAHFEDTVGFGLEDDTTEAAFRFGGGADLFVTEHLAVTTDVTYVLPLGDLDEFDYLSIGWGLKYQF